MKRGLLLLGLFLIALFSFFGCEKKPTEPVVVGAPENFTIVVAGTDSLSLKLSWETSPTSVDGYIIYFENSPIETTAALSYTYKPNSLGDYKVTAYKGTTESSPSNTVSTKLVSAINQGPVYWTNDPDPNHPSGYGWSADGSGACYAIAPPQYPNKDKIDFIVDGYFDLRNPADLYDPTWHTTGIAYSDQWTYDNLAEAPATGYMNFQDVVAQGTYILWVHGKYYVKLGITGVDEGVHSITFKYGFQKIQGFRRLK